MSNINVVMISGAVFSDFQPKETQYGQMGRMRIGVTEIKRGKDGTKKDVCWITVVVYGKMAELCQNLGIVKGTELMVRGKLKLNQWETAGVKKTEHTIIAEEIGILAGNANGKESEELAWHL